MTSVLFDLSPLRTRARTSGVGRYVAELGLALDELASQEEADLRLVGLTRMGLMGPETERDVSGAIRRLLASPEREDRRLWATRIRLGLASVTRELAPDLVHTGDPRATPLGDLRCPRVTTCHDLAPLRYPEQYRDWTEGGEAGRRAIEQRRFNNASHVIAVSETTAQDLVELLDIPTQKISVVHNGVDLGRWSPEPEADDRRVRERHELADRTYVLYVGAAEWRKNPSGMLRGLRAARRRAPEQDVSLAWAAELTPEERRRVQAEAAELGVANALLFLGFVPDADLGALYRGAVAQLCVSRAEGFGYPVVEAMASGCPVITSNRSSTAEIAGSAAWQVDPEDHEAIGEALANLASDPAERSRFSAQGTRRARHFNTERMARATLEVYGLVVAGG